MILTEIQNKTEAFREETEQKNLHNLAIIIKEIIRKNRKTSITITCEEGRTIQGMGREINRKYKCERYEIDESATYDGTPDDVSEALKDGIENITDYFHDYTVKIDGNHIGISQ